MVAQEAELRATGRRKTAVATVRLMAGTGKFEVNGKPVEEYFKKEELRLIVCGWCMGIALWIAPKDDPEGLIIIDSVHQYASQSATYLRSHFGDEG